VLVSNGEHIVRTNPDGRYVIEAIPSADLSARNRVHTALSSHSYIWVSIPDGHSAHDGFYRQVPESSRAVDFTLATNPAYATPEHSLAHITDTHVFTHDGEVAGVDELGEDLERLKEHTGPDMLVATGDLSNWGTMSELSAYNEVTGSVGVPVYSVFGGHDGDQELYEGPGWGASCVRNYEQVLGPVYYSFDRGGRHFVAYAKEDYFFSRYDLIRKERWFWQDLAAQPEGREIVLMMHTPPSKRFLDQLQAYNVALVLHGHTHASKVFTYGRTMVAGLTPLTFGGYDSNPRGFRTVEFGRQGFQFDLVPLGRDRRGSKRVASPPASEGTLGRLVWQTKLPANTHRATPVLYDGDLLVSLQDESSRQQNGVCRVALADGQIVSHFRTDSAVRNSVTVTDGGVCLAITSTGRLYCIDTASGGVRWHVDTPEFPNRWIATSPVVADRVVFVGAKGGYAAYALESGDLVWNKRFVGTPDLTADETGDKWGSYASPLVFEDLLITFVPRRGLVAIACETGQVVWERPLDGTEDYWARPVLADNRLVSGGGQGELLAVAPRSGEDLWREEIMPEIRNEDRFFITPMSSPHSTKSADQRYVSALEVDGGRVYACTSQGQVVCCDLETGSVFWRFQSGPDLLDMNPGRREITSLLAASSAVGDTLLVPGLDGVLYRLDPFTGVPVGRATFGSPLTAAPVLLEDGFAITTWDGHLFRYGV